MNEKPNSQKMEHNNSRKSTLETMSKTIYWYNKYGVFLMFINSHDENSVNFKSKQYCLKVDNTIYSFVVSGYFSITFINLLPEDVSFDMHSRTTKTSINKVNYLESYKGYTMKYDKNSNCRLMINEPDDTTTKSDKITEKCFDGDFIFKIYNYEDLTITTNFDDLKCAEYADIIDKSLFLDYVTKITNSNINRQYKYNTSIEYRHQILFNKTIKRRSKFIIGALDNYDSDSDYDDLEADCMDGEDEVDEVDCVDGANGGATDVTSKDGATGSKTVKKPDVKIDKIVDNFKTAVLTIDESKIDTMKTVIIDDSKIDYKKNSEFNLKFLNFENVFTKDDLLNYCKPDLNNVTNEVFIKFDDKCFICLESINDMNSSNVMVNIPCLHSNLHAKCYDSKYLSSKCAMCKSEIYFIIKYMIAR